MKVLCIDDTEEITTLVDTVLTAKGHEVSICNDGREGLRLIREDNADVILLDLAMPDYSGQDVMDELIKDGTINNYNIIIFTASSMTDSQVDGYIKKGAKFVIRKPVKMDKLLSSIERFNKE